MKKLFYFITLVLLIVIDQLVKVATVLYINPSKPIVVIEEVFELDYVKNTGALFGIFPGGVPVFVIITIILLIVVTYFFLKLPDTKRMGYLRIICLLIAAGGIGNLIDRIYRGYVVDTFSFVLINFPVFNVADCYVTVAEFSLILLILFYYKDDEFNGIFPKMKKKSTVSDKYNEQSTELKPKKGDELGK